MSLDYTPPTPHDPSTLNVWGTAVNAILNTIKTAVNAKLETSVYNAHKNGIGDRHSSSEIIDQLATVLGMGNLDDLLLAIVGSTTVFPGSLTSLTAAVNSIDTKLLTFVIKSNVAGKINIDEDDVKIAFGIHEENYGIGSFIIMQAYTTSNMVEAQGVIYQAVIQTSGGDVDHLDYIYLNNLSSETEYAVVVHCKKIWLGISPV